MRGSEIDKDEQSYYREKESKDSSLSDNSKKNNKRKYLRGHCPFNFFEKEKCKNMDFKKVNVRSYISEISAQWKIMTDEEKAPYVKLSEDFKKKVMETNNLDDLEEMRLSNKKIPVRYERGFFCYRELYSSSAASASCCLMSSFWISVGTSS